MTEVDARRARVPAGPADRLDRMVVRLWPDLSRARAQALIEEGAVSLDGAAAPAKTKVVAGQEIEVRVPPPELAEILPEDLPLTVLYEDADLLVVDKAAGMVVHPAPGHATGTLVNALLFHVRDLGGVGGVERPGIVHRLDAGTSGVLVVAKNDLSHRALSLRFASHDLERRYLAVVHRVPLHDTGTFRSALGRDPQNRLKMASREDGRPAVTHWRALARGDRLALLECRLETGRTHQIRVHLSEAGHPIVGDTTYARRDCTPPAPVRTAVAALDHPLLHAAVLALPHPRTGAPMRWTTQPPPDFVAFCRLAGLGEPALS